MLVASTALKLVLCASQLKLATLGFTQVGLTDAQAAFYADHFSVQLARVDEQNVRVTTPKDMEALLGIEKQKQLLGCADESSSCMAELAGALGADGFVTGQIAKVGQSYQLNVKILAANGTRALFLHSSKLLRSEEELIGELNEVAGLAVAKLRTELTPPETGPAGTATAPAGGKPRSLLRLIPGAVGVIALAIGGGLMGSAGGKYAKLSNPDGWVGAMALTSREAESLREGGKGDLSVGIALVSLGAALLIFSVIWYLI